MTLGLCTKAGFVPIFTDKVITYDFLCTVFGLVPCYFLFVTVALQRIGRVALPHRSAPRGLVKVSELLTAGVTQVGVLCRRKEVPRLEAGNVWKETWSGVMRCLEMDCK